jgi:hypothetical protein
MYCTRCGNSANNNRFCTQCGFKMKKSATQAAYVESNSYNSKTLTAIAVQQVNKTPPSLGELNPNVPPHHQTIVIDQDAAVEQSSEMASLEAPHTTRKGGALALLAVSLILLLSVSDVSGLLRYFKKDRNRQQSTAPVVTENNQAPAPAQEQKQGPPQKAVVTENDQAPAPAPQLKTVQPTNPTPAAPGEKTATNIETKPSPSSGAQPVRKNAVETWKRIGATQKAVMPDREASEFNRDRQMMFDDNYRYRRYRYNSYRPDYRDRFYIRRRFRGYYR